MLSVAVGSADRLHIAPDTGAERSSDMANTTYTIKRNPGKYANLHTCDAQYWAFTADWATEQPIEVLTKSLDFVTKRLNGIVKAKAFKPENIKAAKELLTLVKAEADALKGNSLDLKVESFVCYQLERYTFRLWYRDTRAAREATEPKAPKPKAEPKAPAKQEKPKTEKKPAPAKQEIAKANEATFVSKLTKAQKRDLVLVLLSELLK